MPFYAGIGDVIGGVVSGVSDLLSLIPKALSGLLDGLLGSSRRGDTITLTNNMRLLIQRLPGEIRSGGKNVILATLQTLEDIFHNLRRSVRRGGSLNNINQVFQNTVQILEILQENVENGGSRAALSSIIIELQVLQQTQTATASSIAASLKGIQVSLQAVLDGIKSGSATGGMNGDHDALRSVFIIFQLINTNIQSGNMSSVGGLLQQLQFLLQGVSFSIESNVSFKNIDSVLLLNNFSNFIFPQSSYSCRHQANYL